MKIKNLTQWMAVVAIFAIIFTGCKKELSKPITDNTSSIDLVASDVNALAVQADNDFVNAEILGGTEAEAFSINNDGLPDAYTITEATADEINSAKRSEGTDIRKCLHELNLSDEQIVKIRHIFKGYEDCKKSIIVRHANAAKELVAKYNAKRDELLKALKNGRITKAQFEERMQELRKMYTAEKDALAQKARTALNECYTKMLRGLNGVMTESQWKAFVNCYKH